MKKSGTHRAEWVDPYTIGRALLGIADDKPLRREQKRQVRMLARAIVKVVESHPTKK